jgi:CheY-like chemotaxis protein
VLSSEGFTVDIAGNGLVAVDMLKRTRYDFCISDIRIPEISGIELYRYIQNEHPHLSGNIIFVSGDVLNNEVKHFLKDNTVRFLAKPFSPQELTDAVNGLIGVANAV